MVRFTQKFTGAKAIVFAEVCLHYMEAAERACNDDPEQTPLFSWLSPYQRVQLVRQVMVGLLCEDEPLPPGTIQHYATYRAIVETLKCEIGVELDVQWDVDDVGEDLRLSDRHSSRGRFSEEDMSERLRKWELTRYRANKNKKKLDKTSDAHVDFNPQEKKTDVRQHLGRIQEVASVLFDGPPLSKQDRDKVRKPTNMDEKYAFRWRSLCDDAFQEDTNDDFLSVMPPLSAVSFDFRSNSEDQWCTAIDFLYVTKSDVKSDFKENLLVNGAIDDRSYADPSQFARIQTVKQHISILRKTYERTWDANALAEDQRCVFAVCSNTTHHGYGHDEFLVDFLSELNRQGIDHTEPGSYQERYNIYKAMASAHQESLQHPFYSYRENMFSFDGCRNPTNYTCSDENIHNSCGRHGCFSYRKEDLRKCSRCHVVSYCSRDCQVMDYKRHRKDCQAMAKLRKDKAAVTEFARSL